MELTPHQAKYFAMESMGNTASDKMQKLVPSLVGIWVELNPQEVAARFAFKSRLTSDFCY
jgi:hypothetical protein